MARAAAYNRRSAPAEYDKGWLDVELQNLQRAIVQTAHRTVTVNTTQQVSDAYVWANATGGAFNYTLLAPSLAGPFPVTIKKTDASANAVTIVGTVDGAVNPTLAAQWKAMTVVSDGTQWLKVASI